MSTQPLAWCLHVYCHPAGAPRMWVHKRSIVAATQEECCAAAGVPLAELKPINGVGLVRVGKHNDTRYNLTPMFQGDTWVFGTDQPQPFHV